MTITEGIKPYHGVTGILTHYHKICDLYLGIGRYKIRIIPFACIYFISDMDLPWDPYLVPKDQLKYYSVTKLKYYPILGKHNDQEIMYFI